MSTSDNNNNKCANCGKESSDVVNTCNKCKSVMYCNAACKKKHRQKHKKQCERHVAELHEEKLFRDHPPREECPICLLPLTISVNDHVFQVCCGVQICMGCYHAYIDEASGRGKKKNILCAFCRTPSLISDEEAVKRMNKLVENCNAEAICELGMYYSEGAFGFPQDFVKANELYQKAGELGCSAGFLNLGNAYDSGMGVEVEATKAHYYWELAAMNGNIGARHNLGLRLVKVGDIDQGMKHMLIAARAGSLYSLEVVKVGYKGKAVTKEEYANALRACQERQNEMKSDQREKAKAVMAASGLMRADEFGR